MVSQRAILLVVVVQLVALATTMTTTPAAAASLTTTKNHQSPQTQQPTQQPQDQAQAALGVIQRLLPQRFHSKFQLIIDPSMQQQRVVGPMHSKLDSFMINATNGVVTIHGTSGVALSSGVYWYLKKVTKCIVTWGVNGTGDQLKSLPATLPDYSIAKQSVVPWRYAYNMCTLSYSMVWWDWARWEREIDWLALHGFNLPLALTGMEYVWMKAFAKFNVSLDELQTWFSGPAFLAWQRAGNIRGFAGPLPRGWIVGQYQLQLRILERMRSLGMTPVLPCFSGHVPQITQKLFPNASITQSTPWNNFPANETNAYYLDPTDSLYKTLGGVFMDELVKAYGTDHYYSCDTYNENTPTSSSLSYLKEAASAVHEGIATKDPQGVWVMQAWLFHFGFWTSDYSRVQAYLSGVNKSKMLILDLNSEIGALAPQFSQYYGKHWVWNMLHNYGGRRGVYGNMNRIATGPIADLHAPGSTMNGIGITPEAIEQNPAMYELLTATFWENSAIDAKQWMSDYVTQRYGKFSAGAQAAWLQLFNAVYNQGGEARNIVEYMPQWQPPNFGWNNGDATTMLQSFETFLFRAAPSLQPVTSDNGPFLYDFVDVTRQAVKFFFNDCDRMLVNTLSTAQYSSTFNATDTLQGLQVFMVGLIDDVDAMLGTNSNYLLGKWVHDGYSWALKSGGGSAIIDRFIYNAKNQVTMWGPSGQIDDYAQKAWHDLYGTYYAPRWRLFFKKLIEMAVSGSYQWSQYEYNNEMLALEKSWNADRTMYRNTTTGADPIQVATHIHSKIADPKPLQTEYTSVPNVTIWDSQLPHSPLWTKDLRQLAILCSLTPICQAFDSNGAVYQNGKSTQHSAPGTTLFIKKTFIKKTFGTK